MKTAAKVAGKKRGNRTSFQKGNTLRRDGISGRKKGTPNKMTMNIRDAFLKVFNERGGWEGLMKWVASKPNNLAAFYISMIPRLISQEVTGLNGGPVEFSNVQDRESLRSKILAEKPKKPSKGNGELRDTPMAGNGSSDPGSTPRVTH